MRFIISHSGSNEKASLLEKTMEESLLIRNILLLILSGTVFVFILHTTTNFFSKSSVDGDFEVAYYQLKNVTELLEKTKNKNKLMEIKINEYIR